MELGQLLDIKIDQAKTEYDKMEYVALKCLHTRNYDELFKIFGYDRKQILFDVEWYTGKKIQQPQSSEPSQPIQTPNLRTKEEPHMDAESAEKFFSDFGQGTQSTNQHTNNNNEESKQAVISND